MIPKVIHYCWFGGNPLPRSAKKFIKSWEYFFPGYEIKEWNESNFNIDSSLYTREAYSARKYAFVSDYARFWILYNYGGIYFDTDVEVISSFERIVSNGAFVGCEELWKDDSFPEDMGINPGLGIGAEAGNYFCGEMLKIYSELHFYKEDGSLDMTNIVQRSTKFLCSEGLAHVNEPQSCGGITVYPKEYFCPIDYKTRLFDKTENTVSIHHYAETWLPKRVRFINFLGRVLGKNFILFLVLIKRKFIHNGQD